MSIVPLTHEFLKRNRKKWENIKTSKEKWGSNCHSSYHQTISHVGLLVGTSRRIGAHILVYSNFKALVKKIGWMIELHNVSRWEQQGS